MDHYCTYMLIPEEGGLYDIEEFINYGIRMTVYREQLCVFFDNSNYFSIIEVFLK